MRNYLLEPHVRDEYLADALSLMPSDREVIYYALAAAGIVDRPYPSSL